MAKGQVATSGQGPWELSVGREPSGKPSVAPPRFKDIKKGGMMENTSYYIFM